MTSRIRHAVGWALFALLLLAAPAPARASGNWPWPVTGSRVLAYGATYRTSAGVTNTHGGLDIAGTPGDRVHACVSGEVVFAGKVPAGEGAQAIAITVLTADGLRITYLPLASVTVSAGGHIAAGDGIGTLADQGDASGSAVHLHLGVRRAGTRLDPETFLAPAVEPVASPPAAKASPSSHRAPSGSSAAAAAPSVMTSPMSPALAARPGSVGEPEPVSARDVLREGAADAAAALDRMPRLRRIRSVRESKVLAVSRIWSDVTDVQGALGRMVLALALTLVAAGCVLAVMRSAGERGGTPAASPVPVRAGWGVDR